MTEADALSIDQWRTLREVAEHRTHLIKAVTDVTPYSGLTTNELAHLRQEWIYWNEDYVKIEIPARDSCNDWKHTSGTKHGSDHLPPLKRRTKSCRYCRKWGESDEFEAIWGTASLEKEARPRTVILHNDLAEPAIEWIKMIFKTHDRPEVSVTPSTFQNAVNVLRDDVRFDFTYQTLMKTQIVIYGKYDLALQEIDSLSPYTGKVIRRTIAETPGVKHREVGIKCNTKELLQQAENLDQFTAAEITETLPIGRRNVYDRLDKLETRNRIRTVGDCKNPYTYEITLPASEPLSCDYDDCDFRTDSLRGILLHESRIHDCQ